MPKKENRLVECACGCGGTLPERDNRGRKRVWLKGHCNKNKKTLREVVYENYTVSADGCWEWGKSLTSKGYGDFGYHGQKYQAHRASFEIENGVKLNRNEHVCHRCDNPKCINPDHLFVGTQLDNINDCIRKKRMVGAVSDRSISLIREMYRYKMYTQIEIATLFKITQAAISKIVRMETRKSASVSL